MNLKWTILGVGSGISTLILGLPLLAGVWLPDLFLGGPRTLASLALSNGYTLQVVQYWNHVDFYSTELRVRSPDGRTQIHTLDGDDAKRWRVPLSVNEQRRTASIALDGQPRTISW